MPDGTTRAGLSAKKDELVAKRDEVQDKLNDRETSSGTLKLLKVALLPRLNSFNENVRAVYGNTKWVVALPKAYSVNEGQSNVMGPLGDANSLWQKINADPATTSPIVQADGYTQAQFNTDFLALRAAYESLGTAVRDLKLVREERNDIQDVIYDILKSYRLVLPTKFAEGDAIVVDLLPQRIRITQTAHRDVQRVVQTPQMVVDLR